MDDAAAFFAKKKTKGKKKAFKFNANNIDASAVTQTVHVDAPALSTGLDSAIAGLSLSPSSIPAQEAGGGENDKGTGEQWDDEALAETLTRKTAVAAPGTGTMSELMDMKAFDPKRNEQDNIAEKLRVEENKAKLAAAREGMEREAQRLKEAQEKKKEAASAGASRFAGAADGSKWVPPHMRAGALPKIRMGAGGGNPNRVDTQDENLFPDLAAADAIIEQQKQQQPAFKMAKKTPVGGGASWASKPKAETKPETPKKAVQPPPEPTPAPAPPAPVPPPEKPKPEEKSESSPAKPVAKPLGKKKKKDLSSFKL